MKVKDLMTQRVEAANQQTPIRDVAKTMKELNVGAIPICDDDNRPVGIVTDRDLVVRGIVEGFDINSQVEQIMSNHVVYASPEMDIHEAAKLMGSHQIRRLPVVDQGKMVGMISIGDMAVEGIHENEAGEALGEISHPAKPWM